MTEPLDARGVTIAPGDTVIFAYSSFDGSVMGEGVVLGVDNPPGRGFSGPASVSLTPSGYVRVVVARASGPDVHGVVGVPPDRIIVVKELPDATH